MSTSDLSILFVEKISTALISNSIFRNLTSSTAGALWIACTDDFILDGVVFENNTARIDGNANDIFLIVSNVSFSPSSSIRNSTSTSTHPRLFLNSNRNDFSSLLQTGSTSTKPTTTFEPHPFSFPKSEQLPANSIEYPTQNDIFATEPISHHLHDTPSIPLSPPQNPNSTIPNAASVTRVVSSCVDSTGEQIYLLLVGTEFPTGQTYVVSLIESRFFFTITFLSATSSKTNSLPVMAGVLELGTVYTVNRVYKEDSPAMLIDVVNKTFLTPTLVTHAVCEFDEWMSVAVVTLTGSRIGVESISLFFNGPTNLRSYTLTRVDEYTLQTTLTISGETPQMVFGAEYELSANSVLCYVYPGLSFVVPYMPECLSVLAEWVDGATARLAFKVEARGVILTPTENYIVSLQSPSYKFNVSFSSSSEGATDPIDASGSFALSWDTTYTITSIIQDVSTSPKSLICTGITFTIPEPRYLSSIKCTPRDAKCEEFILTIKGSNLAISTFVASFDETTETVDLKTTSTTEGASAYFTVASSVFALGTQYTLKSVVEKTSSASSLILMVTTFTTPSLIDTAVCTLDASETSVTLKLSGSPFLSNTVTLNIVDQNSNVIPVSFTLNGDVYEATLTIEGASPQLIGGQTCTITSSLDDLFVYPGLSFLVPTKPMCMSASVEWVSPGFTELEMKLSGMCVPSTPTPDYVVSLSGSSYQFTVTFSSHTSGMSDPVAVSLPFDVPFGQEYTIDSVIQDTKTDSVSLVCTDIKFTIPHPPIVTSVACTPKDDNCASIMITIAGTNFVKSSYAVQFNEIANPITVTVTSATIGTSAYFSVGSGNLALGMLYTLKSVVETVSPFRTFLHQTNPVLTPSVVTGIVCTLNTAETFFTITLSGSAFSSNSANIDIVNSSSGSDTVVFTKNGDDYQLDVPVGSPFLISGQTFTIRSLDTGLFIKPGLTFEVPYLPMITGASLEWTDTSFLNVVFKIDGVGLPSPSTSNFVVSIASSSVTFTVKFSSNTTGKSDPILVTLPFALDWEQEYTLSSVIEDVSSSPRTITCPNVKFTTPTPPHLTTARIQCTSPICTSIRLYFQGQNLGPMVPFDVTIAESSFTFQANFYTSTTGQSEQITVWPTCPFPLTGFTLKTITESGANPAQWVLTDRISTIVPQAEITTVICELDNTATTLTVLFHSVFVKSSTLSINVEDSAGNQASIQATLVDDVLTATEVIYPTSSSGLTFGESYKLTSTDNSSVHILTSLSIVVPEPPKVTQVEAKCADVKCTVINLALTGQNFIVGPKFVLTLNEIANPIEFSCDTRTHAMVGPITIGAGMEMLHSSTYSLLSIIENTTTLPQHILCNGISFSTPNEPALTTIFVSTSSGEDTDFCGSISRQCLSLEHSQTRLHDECFTLMLQGSFNHSSLWTIRFTSFVLAHNTLSVKLGKFIPSTVNVGSNAGFLVNGPTSTRFQSISFILPSASTNEVYLHVLTGEVTIMDCSVIGDIPKVAGLLNRHPAFVQTKNVVEVSTLETARVGHLSMATLTGTQTTGFSQLNGWTAASIETESEAGSAAFFTLSNSSSLALLSSTFTSCSSGNKNCLGGAVSFTLSDLASLVIQSCSFIGCCVNDFARGGAIGLTLSSTSSNDFLLDSITFAHNSAGYGRDFFLYTQSLEKSVTIDHFQFNLYPPDYIRSNALFGSDRITFVEETDLFPFLFSNHRFKIVFVDSMGQTGLASNLPECGQETHPCMSMRESMDHLMNPDSEEEVTQCVLERGLVLLGDLVVTDAIDVELCGYLNIRQQDGLVLSLIPLETHNNIQTDQIKYGRVRFDQDGSLGCKLSFGMTEIVPIQTVNMKHLEFVLPRFSEHTQPVIAVQSVCVSITECVVKAADSTLTSSPFISFNSTLTSMPARVRLTIFHLTARDLLLSKPLISVRTTAELPVFMDSILTGHASSLNQTSPFSLSPLLSVDDSVFERITLKITSSNDEVEIRTGSVLFADLSLPLSNLTIRGCSFSSCSVVVVSLPTSSDFLSSFSAGTCSISLTRSHFSLADSSFSNCSFSVDPTLVLTPSPDLLALSAHTLAIRSLPSRNLSTLASPLSVTNLNSPLIAKILSSGFENPSFIFDDRLRQTPLSSYLTIVGVEVEAGDYLDPAHPLPLSLILAQRSTPELEFNSNAFVFGAADASNVGLIVAMSESFVWPDLRHMLFANCTAKRLEMDT
ncbi:hypothetical protein BLNAU_1037 [Blattamonas nauphoetae]|uniref:IPT/TIG domain-containing protein n=1 Tax=Blattamonas nauphoetae TaxID=2049346 RepID=A0ABQ9YJM3_9EUKA|nr:hypothetical protein BLNAU_1037 [Blattamonas nauphoetae]